MIVLLEHNPGFKFVIGLVDRVPPPWDPTYWEHFQLIPIENLGVSALPDMIDKYDMIENTAVTKEQCTKSSPDSAVPLPVPNQANVSFYVNDLTEVRKRLMVVLTAGVCEYPCGKLVSPRDTLGNLQNR